MSVKQKEARFKQINKTFSPLVIPGVIAPFLDEKVSAYLTQASPFSLSLNRVKSKGFLYGNQQVKCRQDFFNHLSMHERISLMKKKLTYQGVWGGIENRLNALKNNQDQLSEQIDNVIDIGKGHSVYKISFSQKVLGTNRHWVIKENHNNFQCFYHHLLKVLGWPSGQSMFINAAHASFEWTTFLGEKTLQDQINQMPLTADLIEQIAKQAACSDLMGRGDRHLDNYIVTKKGVIPIDISFLFWKDNESWLDQYLKAGMSEFSLLYHHGLPDPDQMNLFFKSYNKAIKEIEKNKQGISDVISIYFRREDAMKNQLFFEERLKESYHQTQKERYKTQSEQYIKRKKYKLDLIKINQSDPAWINQNPLLKMYLLADENKSSAFFLLDYFQRQDLLDLIETKVKQL